MASTIAAIAMVAMLGAWHLRIRRHANWRFSSDGRFYITLGYPAVAIAVYWLTPSASGTDSMWILGTLWSFAAMVCFVRGFDALDQPAARQHRGDTPADRGHGSAQRDARQ